MELLNCGFANRVVGVQWESKLVPYIRKYSMRNKSSIVTSAADGCGKLSSIRSMDNSHRNHKGAEYKESFMLCKSFSVVTTAATICLGCFSWAASAHASTVNFGFNTTGDNSTGWTFILAGYGATGDGSPQSPSFYFLASGNQSVAYQQSTYATESPALGSDPLVQGTYTITFITAPTAGPSPITAMDVTAFDATKSTQLGTLQYAYNPDTMKNWQTVNFTFNTTAANVGDYLALQFSAIPSSSYAGNNYYFGVDTITGTVVAVPEPATLGLVSIGAIGLMLLKRRKVV